MNEIGVLLLDLVSVGVVPGLTVAEVVFAGVVALMGAGSAAGSLVLARREDDRELLEAGEMALGLTTAD